MEKSLKRCILQFIRWEVYGRVLHSAVQINHVTWYFFYVLFSTAGLSLDSVNQAPITDSVVFHTLPRHMVSKIWTIFWWISVKAWQADRKQCIWAHNA